MQWANPALHFSAMDPRVIDLTGRVFGTWTVLSHAGRSNWLCRCQCGAERVSGSKALRKGQRQDCDTCGIRSCTKLVDMVGYKVGRLTAISRADRPDRRGHGYWLCRCECGKEKAIHGKHLRMGKTLSCGCLVREMTATRNATQGGLAVANRRLYGTWTSMIRRCEEQPDYAGRGISVCERWRNSFAAFLSDMGPKPTPRHTIERINNDGNYEPTNCKWATRHEQMRNTRGNRYVETNGKRMIVTDWAAETGLDIRLIYGRMANGWTPEEAVATPARHITKTRLYVSTRPRKAA